MGFDPVAAVVAGIVATVVMTAVMMLAAPMMGVKMDMPMMLGTMFLPKGNAAWAVGLGLHMMMGVVFLAVYAVLFDVLGLQASLTLWGGLFGAVHGLMAGASMAMMPLMHPRIQAGGVESAATVADPGLMGVRLGSMAPVAIVALHVLFGLVGGFAYAKFA